MNYFCTPRLKKSKLLLRKSKEKNYCMLLHWKVRIQKSQDQRCRYHWSMSILRKQLNKIKFQRTYFNGKRNKVIWPVFGDTQQCIHNSHRRIVEEQDIFRLQQDILLRRKRERKKKKRKHDSHYVTDFQKC
jgi:hypothetical protein